MRALTIAAAMAAVLAFSGVAEAAVVAIGGTGSAGAGGFNLISSGVSTDTGNGAYFNGPTIVGGQPIASGWVWPQDEGGFAPNATYEFTFNLTGFDVASAVLEGLWGVDNFGSVFLNDVEISSLPGVNFGNFAILHAFSATLDSLFNAGANVLRFSLGNAEAPGFNPAAFRAAVRVTADQIPSQVPLPGALPLFAAGIGAFAFARGRRQAQ